MKVLITGGAGYIGQSLMVALESNPTIKNILVLDNLSSSSQQFFLGTDKLNKITFIKGDILNFDLLEKIVKDVDIVYHLAAITNHAYTYAQNVQFEQVNQWGTLNLVRSLQMHALKLKKFYYLSSMSVYGLNRIINIDNDLPQPNNSYAISKFEAEKYASLLQDKCNVEIIRAANVFGFNSGFRKDSVLNNFIFNSILHKKITIYGDGEQSRPFLSIEKLVSFMLESINLKAEKTLQINSLIEFNSNLNELKDWLLTIIPDLEFTYLNSNITYDGQFAKGFESVEHKFDLLNDTFNKFKQNIRIQHA